MVRLNLGAGSSIVEGYTPLDRKLGSEIYPLPMYEKDSVDVVRASHCLEHFPKTLTLAVLAEWTRVLKPGGILKIAVPDFEYAIEHADHPHFEGWIMGGQSDKNDFHYSLFNREKLTELLKLAGLEDIKPWTSEINDCASLPVSLNLQGTKPNPKSSTFRVPKIACALSLPRLGFTDNWGCINAAFAAWSMPIRQYRGVWWERCLQNILEDLIAEGFEMAVTKPEVITYKENGVEMEPLENAYIDVPDEVVGPGEASAAAAQVNANDTSSGKPAVLKASIRKAASGSGEDAVTQEVEPAMFGGAKLPPLTRGSKMVSTSSPILDWSGRVACVPESCQEMLQAI